MNKIFIYQHPLLLRQSKGFTLIEVLLAVTIFALLSLMFVGTLNYLISALSSQKTTYKQFQIPDMAYQQIKLDVTQAIRRSVLDKSGNDIPVFFGGQEHGGNTWEADVGLDFSHDATLFEFTRGGNIASLSGEYSANLERVSYVFQGGRIIRYSWPVLDRVEETTPFPQILLDNIQNISVEFLGDDGTWHSGWQPKKPLFALVPGELNINKPPLAIKMVCVIAGQEPMEWKFWIGQGAPSV